MELQPLDLFTPEQLDRMLAYLHEQGIRASELANWEWAKDVEADSEAENLENPDDEPATIGDYVKCNFESDRDGAEELVVADYWNLQRALIHAGMVDDDFNFAD